MFRLSPSLLLLFFRFPTPPEAPAASFVPCYIPIFYFFAIKSNFNGISLIKSSLEGYFFVIDEKVLAFKYVFDLMSLIAKNSSAAKRGTDSSA